MVRDISTLKSVREETNMVFERMAPANGREFWLHAEPSRKKADRFGESKVRGK